MKRTLFLLLCAVMIMVMLPVLPITALTSGDFSYELLTNGTASITKYTGTDTEIVIPATIDGYTVTEIGEDSFYYSKVVSVVIPDGVTTIGKSAFFSSNLESIIMPDSVTTIGAYAFMHSDLKNIVIPNSVTSIGARAFMYSGLQNVVIPNSVTTIEKETFRLCKHLTAVTIPDSVTRIGDNAFSGCFALTHITIPGSVTHIGKEAFYLCKSLVSVTLSPGLIEIGSEAFSWCQKLTNITIPDGTTWIEHRAFYTCSRLTDVTIPKSVTTIYYSAFEGVSSSQLTIHGFYGSRAHSFAQRYKYAFDMLDRDEYRLATVNEKSTLYRPGSTVESSVANFYVKDGYAYRFKSWSGNADFADANSTSTTFVMPEEDVTVTAEYMLVGDINNDGTISSTDSLLLLQMLVGKIPFSSAGDIDGDGQLTPADSLYMLQYAVGKYIPKK